MDIDNNQYEVKPVNSKRKITALHPNIYLNPALDLLANEDPMCNTAMEIVPNKKRKRSKSCDIIAFENTGLDLGVNKEAVNEFLVRELENVKRNVKYGNTEAVNDSIASNPSKDSNLVNLESESTAPKLLPKSAKAVNDSIENEVTNAFTEDTGCSTEPIYANVTKMADTKDKIEEHTNTFNCSDISRIPHEDFDTDSGISVLEQKSSKAVTNTENSNIASVQTNVTNQLIINNASNLSLSFIDRLALDSPNLTDQSLYLDDDLNESNIMEIKTITIITKKKRVIERKNTNPFLDPNLDVKEVVKTSNPFLEMKPEIEYQDEVLNRAVDPQSNCNVLMPRRLFSGDTNSTISTVNESSIESQHEYENIDHFRAESPIYENIDEANNFNKQSKILGHDVSRFSAVDIMNLNKMSQGNTSNESQESKKDHKHSFLKAGNKLSKKVFKTLKKTFKHDKVDANVTLNPYEVPRKLPKQKAVAKDSGIENPALNLDNSDDMEIEELSDEEHQYETIKTRRNTQLNMNVTPLRVKDNDIDFLPNKTNTPGKKVRFDSTLNQEKVITGNSFDYGLQSPGFDAKIDKYHDELENCINERKFLQQNM